MAKHESGIAALITEEMGKPLLESHREVQKCVRVAQYFMNEIPTMLEQIKRPNVIHQPLGIILGIMPWNFPYWQMMRFILPNMLMGNVCLIKHAPNVPRSTQFFIQLCREAGLDDSVIQYTFISNSQTEALIRDNRIKGVSLTGSEKAGRAVGAVASESLKPVVLELGGSDPFIVCDDADLDLAAQAAVQARFGNAGQVCISAKRFIIHDTIFDSFKDMFLSIYHYLKWGILLIRIQQYCPARRFA